MHGGYHDLVLGQRKYKDRLFSNTYWRGQHQSLLQIDYAIRSSLSQRRTLTTSTILLLRNNEEWRYILTRIKSAKPVKHLKSYYKPVSLLFDPLLFFYSPGWFHLVRLTPVQEVWNVRAALNSPCIQMRSSSWGTRLHLSRDNYN